MAFGIRKIGIDLGTASVIVVVPPANIVVNEPSVVALEASSNRIMAIGQEAKEMLGRTPESIISVHPLREGVIANFRVTEAMIRHYINKISGRVRLIKPDVMVAIPAGVTSTERRAVIDATLAAGARQAYIIKEPIAAALGAGITISSPTGNMIIDIGGGTSEVAVIALGDIVASSSVRVAGNQIDEAIATYVRKKHNLIIGLQTAEVVKKEVGAAFELNKTLSMEVSGSNVVTGLPESVIVTSTDVINAVKEPLNKIIAAVKEVLQKTPPELAADVMDKGIVLSGGGSLLRNIEQLMTKVTGVPCQLADDPELCVAKGTGLAVEHLDEFKRSVLWSK